MTEWLEFKDAVMQAYLREWRVALRALRGWNDAQTDAWVARHMLTHMSAHTAMYHTERPGHYVGEAFYDLLSKNAALGRSQWGDFADELETAMYGEAPESRLDDPKFHMAGAVHRARGVLAKYGMLSPTA